jgi:hypothetical protein
MLTDAPSGDWLVATMAEAVRDLSLGRWPARTTAKVAAMLAQTRTNLKTKLAKVIGAKVALAFVVAVRGRPREFEASAQPSGCSMATLFETLADRRS